MYEGPNDDDLSVMQISAATHSEVLAAQGQSSQTQKHTKQ